MVPNHSSQPIIGIRRGPSLVAGPTAGSTDESRNLKIHWGVWILVFGAGFACSVALNILTWWIFAQWATR